MIKDMLIQSVASPSSPCSPDSIRELTLSEVEERIDHVAKTFQQNCASWQAAASQALAEFQPLLDRRSAGVEGKDPSLEKLRQLREMAQMEPVELPTSAELRPRLMDRPDDSPRTAQECLLNFHGKLVSAQQMMGSLRTQLGLSLTTDSKPKLLKEVRRGEGPIKLLGALAQQVSRYNCEEIIPLPLLYNRYRVLLDEQAEPSMSVSAFSHSCASLEVSMPQNGRRRESQRRIALQAVGTALIALLALALTGTLVFRYLHRR